MIPDDQGIVVVREVVGTLVGRWYVTLFGVMFAVLSVRQLGWRRTGIYTAFAIAIGALAENASVHFGIPYTRYAFNNELRGNEVFLGDVPLMVPLSYTFMAYFSFGSARLIVSGPHRTRSTMPVLEYLVAVMLAVWALWIIDPVSRLGAHFFLGELFRYDGPGFWFGLPLASQAGYALTSAVLVGALTYLTRDEPAVEVPSLHRHPQLPALGGYLVQVAFMTVSAFAVARLSNNPAVVRQADALAGATFVIATPVVLLSAVLWHALGHHSIVGAPTSRFPHTSGAASPGAPRFVSRTIPPAS